jgi:hypothetical protein
VDEWRRGKRLRTFLSTYPPTHVLGTQTEDKWIWPRDQRIMITVLIIGFAIYIFHTACPILKHASLEGFVAL